MKTANRNFNISIVIAAFNEEEKIIPCFKSLAEQRFENIKVILVDDCSSDKTLLIAKQVGARLGLDLKIIKLDKHQERSIARNIGARKSVGNYLIFIDVDMKLSKNVITECVRLIQRSPNIKAVIIPEESFGKGFWAKCRKLEKLCYIGDDRVEAARFFEKTAFWKVGGWNNKMISGEDWDLTGRIRSKYKIGRIPSKIYHNEYQLTLWKVIKKKFYYASVSGIYLEKNPLTILGLVFFIFRPAYVRNWKLIISDPIHGIGMFFLKGVELIAGFLGFIYSKLGYRL